MTGRIVIMGSGELAPGLVATHRAGIEAANAERVLVLDSPFGFQENAPQLTERIREFFETSLAVPTELASLRARDASIVDRERFLAAIRSARYVFAGPGSPSYALELWKSADAGDALADMVLAGGTLCFASGAALTLGRSTIPVYEIYKVGEPPVWLEGLDVMTAVGVPCSVIPHWDNTEGGNHDTSRCYIGDRRFRALAAQLEVGVVGVDEHTAATIDLASEELSVSGRATVTLLGAEQTELTGEDVLTLDETRWLLGSQSHPMPGPTAAAATTSMRAVADQRDPDALLAALLEAEQRGSSGSDALRAMLVEVVELARPGLAGRRQAIAPLVELLIEVRRMARAANDYEMSDRIRDGLQRQGIELRDTADGAWWGVEESQTRSWGAGWAPHED